MGRSNWWNDLEPEERIEYAMRGIGVLGAFIVGYAGVRKLSGTRESIFDAIQEQLEPVAKVVREVPVIGSGVDVIGNVMSGRGVTTSYAECIGYLKAKFDKLEEGYWAKREQYQQQYYAGQMDKETYDDKLKGLNMNRWKYTQEFWAARQECEAMRT